MSRLRVSTWGSCQDRRRQIVGQVLQVEGTGDDDELILRLNAATGTAGLT
jgi:hypothetical protein